MSAAAAEEVAENTKKDIWNRIFHPEMLTHLYEEAEDTTAIPLTVYLFREGDEVATETITLSPFYPFYTMNDIKTAIYVAKGEAPEFAPVHQFLAKEPADVETGHSGMTYIAADYFYQRDGIVQSLLNPFKALNDATPDIRFVDSAGNRILSGISRDRTTYEDLFSDKTDPKRHIFHVYLLKDVLDAFQTIKPLSEQQHNGYIMSYFPHSTPEMDGITLPADMKKNLDRFARFFTERRVVLSQIEERLDGIGEMEMPSIRDVKYLRFVWLSKSKKETLDYQFYKTMVTETLPFLRYFPTDTTPVTKLRVKGTSMPIPNLEDPCLLLHWAKEKSPSKDQDALLGKILIRSSYPGMALYATLHVLSDGTAALIIDPKPLTKMTPDIHLAKLRESVTDGIQTFLFSETTPEIREANLVANLTVPAEQPNIGSVEMRRRLKLFDKFFNEISPLPGEHPLISLRYNAVSNYFNDKNVYSYLSQLASRHEMGDSESAVAGMIEKLQEMYVLTQDEATTAYRKWYEIQTDNQVIEPTHDKFKLRNNLGIDIVITSKHPNYTFTVYRVDSYMTLRRILTLLSLMLTLPKRAFDTAVVRPVEEPVAAAVAAPPEEVAIENLGEEVLGLDNAALFGMEEDVLPNAVADTMQEVGEEAGEEAAEPPPPAAAPNEEEATQEPPETLAKIDVSRFFLSRLQKADKELFGDAKSSAKDKSVYARMCAANTSRQPLVMDELAFQRMMTMYRSDIDARKMDIVIYGYDTPAPPSRPQLPFKDVREQANRTFFVLKYGTKITDQHYYLCCEFFCIKDELLVRKDEFEGTVDRNGRPKARNSCPFCKGTLVTAKHPKEGETVLRRKVKANTQDKVHTYIGFLTSKSHSSGFGLPCCFTGEKLSPSDKYFDPLRRATTAPAAVETVVHTEPKKRTHYDYQDIIQRIRIKYIVKAEAIPLEIGVEPQIGLLPEPLNRYFQQTEQGIVTREHIRQLIAEDASAFLRIAVDNRPEVHADAFLSAIAPFLLLNNAEQVKKRLREVIKPKVFVAANYGNLLLEFFTAYSITRPKTLNNVSHVLDKILSDFASRELNVTPSSQFYIQRIYQAYTMFMGGNPRHPDVLGFLNDPTAVKQYRQFAPILAQPGLLSERGILLIVLELRKDGSFEVLCPPYGVSQANHFCDIGFLFHKILEKGDIWEPIFYTQKVETGRITTFTFQHSLRASWPPALLAQVNGKNGFMKLCHGPSVTYTGLQRLKKGSYLISLTNVVQFFSDSANVYGVVRNSYNHIVAALFLMRENEEESERTKLGSPLITIPVLDDGVIRQELYLYPDWTSYTSASAEVVARFYKENSDLFNKFPGYTPKYTVTRNGLVYALQLESGIFIPVSQPSSPELIQTLATDYAITEIPRAPTRLEWDINNEIGSDKYETGKLEPYIRSEATLNELYQQFRLMFSDWIVSADATTVRHDIKKILYHERRDIGIDLPEYEKRARLRDIIAPLLSSWLTSDAPTPALTGASTLLRKSCAVMKTKGECSGSCVWRNDTCLLHIPETTPIDGKAVSVRELFHVRLLDELLRFPARREQLLQLHNRHVSSMAEVHKAVLVGHMYILPENSSEWAELLRMDCRQLFTEQPLFHEEMSTAPQTAPVPPTSLRVIELPTSIANEFGTLEDPKRRNFRLVEWDIPPTDVMKRIASVLHTRSKIEQLDPVELNAIVQEIHTGVAVYDMTATPPKLYGWRYTTHVDTVSYIYLLVKTAETQFRFIKHVYTRDIEPLKIAELPALLRYRVDRLSNVAATEGVTVAVAAAAATANHPE